MPRFGVFFIPPARSPLFRLGTSILGYDARREQLSHEDNFIRSQLPDFDEEFVKRPQKHGIHCTMVAPQTCRYGDLDAISNDIERILNCFAQTTSFEIQAKQELVSYWGKKQQIAVLQYEANSALLMLHTLLVSQLIKYAKPVTGLPTQDVAHEYHRIHNFNTPFIFDGYTPHFTILFPYKGKRHVDMTSALYSIFGQFKKLVLESICLMVQPSKKDRWYIHREYHRLSFPQDLD